MTSSAKNWILGEEKGFAKEFLLGYDVIGNTVTNRRRQLVLCVRRKPVARTWGVTGDVIKVAGKWLINDGAA